MSVWQAIELPGEKALIRARFYSHDTARPCVIMGHGYSATVDDLVADAYAEVFGSHCGATASVAVLF